MTPAAVADVLRPLVPGVLGRLVRRYGQFDACEDALQEALLAAVTQWPGADPPANPGGWLYTVASRRLVDAWRSDASRRQREERAQRGEETLHASVMPEEGDVDDSLTLLFLCCHPSLGPEAQVALTLRAVGGLTTAEIARAFFVPEATMAQRISRAKQRLRTAGGRFEPPVAAAWSDRIGVVLRVLYLIYNEGYAASAGNALHRVELTAEAIRLTRWLCRLAPDASEVEGLLGLMLLTEARRAARLDTAGQLVPLAAQDRSRWDHRLIATGVALVTRALGRGTIGPFQVQAAIAAVHAAAPTAAATDWDEIVGLYRVLRRLAPSPVVELNLAVALGMRDGPAAGLRQLATVTTAAGVGESHRVDAVRAHLLEMAGERQAARANYLRAARATLSLPERRYLLGRASRLQAAAPEPGDAPPVDGAAMN